MESLQEIEARYIIPGLRSCLAKAMEKLGLKQVEIADRLGITKAAVNQYLKDKRGSEIKFSEKIRKEVQKSAKNIKNIKDSIREIQYLLNLTRKEKVVCQVHKSLDKEFSNCNVCFERNLLQMGGRR